jgi:hypothetical protein
MMRTWKLPAVAGLLLATAGGAQADEAPAGETKEVAVASSPASQRRVEEVVATAKRSPATDDVTLSVSDVELEVDLSVERIVLARPKLALPRKPELE